MIQDSGAAVERGDDRIDSGAELRWRKWSERSRCGGGENGRK
ncbi:hypothetical protein SLEP1_g46141 [Rubroshorea leprosula]|uniref:Uncharacterized protein n=1 Tax=Rubroshorea leprosula TaxID=152421 RepID=A0AAV5LLB2_9ROSI|nr:hypothetical protein SLEP1_g46141 [Rubroshorea leprosula]